MAQWIYLAAVLPDPLAQDAVDGPCPAVSTPLGPYGPDETDAIARGRAWLEDVYGTEDIRDYAVEYQIPPENAQMRILSQVRSEVWAAELDDADV